MDESSFDDLIKSKLENYEDSTIDPGALAGFQEKLLASQPAPWYSQNYARLGIAASAVIVTLVNLYILSLYKSANESTVLTKENLRNERTHDSLTRVITNLENQRQLVVKDLDSKSNQLVSFSKENEALRKSIQVERQELNKVVKNELPRDQSSIVTLGNVADIPARMLKILRDQELIMVDNDQAYLFASYRLKHVQRQGDRMERLNEIELFSVSGIQDPDFNNLKIQSPTTVIVEKKRYMSLKQRNELEKHYFSGIGINVGAHLDLVQSSFSSGNGSINPRIGVLADWVVSPRLSVETGVDYLANSIGFEKNLQDIFLPRQNEDLGPIQTAEIDNKLISSPVSIKYRQWVGEKTQAILKLGYTPHYSFSSSYVYGYPHSKPDHPNDPDDPAYHMPRINIVENSTIRGYYGGSATASIGLSRLINKKNLFEASLFYEKSLGTVGQQGLKMDQIGIRTAYLFKVR